MLWCALWLYSQNHAHQCISTDFTMMMAKASQKCRLMRATLLWVVLKFDPFIIPPPHKVASLRDCLVYVEGVSGHDVQLLENEDEEVILNDGNAIALLTDNFPGPKEAKPIMFYICTERF